MNYRPGRTEVRVRVDGSSDAWRLYACTYEDQRLVWVQDWETAFAVSRVEDRGRKRRKSLRRTDEPARAS